VDVRLFAAAVAATVAAAVLSVYVDLHPLISQDVTLERDVQATSWGPLALSFPVFSFIGDAKGAVIEAVVFLLILIVNRRAWLIAVGAAVSGGWYILINHIVLRARPTVAQVLQVKEHPSGSSYPSGHEIFIVTLVTVLMVCLGLRFLPRWAQVVGWVIAACLVVLNAIGRVDVGAHWPTDVLAGFLIAFAWLSLWLSIRPVHRRIGGAESP
jgi:undecaprenyl-diphosphatase